MESKGCFFVFFCVARHLEVCNLHQFTQFVEIFAATKKSDIHLHPPIYKALDNNNFFRKYEKQDRFILGFRDFRIILPFPFLKLETFLRIF